MKNNKTVLSIVISLICAVAMVSIYTIFNLGINNSVEAVDINSNASIQQNIIGQVSEPKELVRVDVDGEFIGYISNNTVLTNYLSNVYNTRYEENYPNTEISFGDNVHLTVEPSFLLYENKDSEILSYLDNLDNYLIKTNAVDFSDENGVFATIYVTDLDLYEEVLHDYLALFVGNNDYEVLTHGGTTDALSDYGYRNVSITILQTITERSGYASESEIKSDYDSIFYYLMYSDKDPSELEYTEIGEYESIYSLASRYGLNSIQLEIINANTIKDEDQALPPGTQVCVTYLNSPIDVVVNKESLMNEVVYPDQPIYVEDETIRIGESSVQQEEVNGSRDVLRSEQWVNGDVVSASEISSQTVSSAQQAIIRVGTKVIPSVGTGTWRYPIDNPSITSRVGWDSVNAGYPGHNGTDFQSLYNRYGNVYAVDNGVVEIVGYDGTRGYWVLINHNNGVKSQYNHLNTMAYVEVGDIVQKGDVIGQIGMTGKASGPHVHLGVWVNGVAGNACDGFLDCDGLDR